MARTRKITSKATLRTPGAPDKARLMEEYRRRSGLLREPGEGPVLRALQLLDRVLEIGLPDPTDKELWMDPLRQNWPEKDLLDLLGRAVFHRACDPDRPQRVRDHALIFLAGVVGINHPGESEPLRIISRETATHHILGGNWGKPRAWLARAIEAGNFAVAAEQFAVAVREGALDHSREPGAFNRHLRIALGGGNTTVRQTRRR